MDKRSIITALSDNYLKLTDTCMDDLMQFTQVLNYNKENKIVNEGQRSDKIYFIFKGGARAFYLKDGKDITDWFAFENDFICAISSFFLNDPSPLCIEALETSILLEISKDNIFHLSEKYREIVLLEKMIFTKTILQLQQKIVSVQFETAAQKYENLLKIRPDITQRVPLTHIASYLGITLETLSRIRNAKKQNLT